MATGVKVTFSASIKDLIDATNSVKSAIDSVAEQAAAANEALGKFGEITGIAISIEGVKRLVESMAELGEHTEKMSAILGISTTSVQQLGYIAKLTGTDADGMALAFERFQANLQRAQNPTSQQAAALRALGLSSRELIGLPLDVQMDKVANAFSRFADGGNKTAVAMQMFGRAGAQMIPILDQGAGGFEKLQAQAVAAGAIMSGHTIEALDDVYKHSVTLKASLTTLGGELVALASSSLINFDNELTASVAGLTQLIEAGDLGTYALRELRGIAEQLVAQLGRLGVALKDIFSGNWGEKFATDMAAANAVAAATDKSLADDLANIQARAAAAYKAILSVHDAAGKSGGKPQVPAIDVNRGGENSARMAAMNAEIELENKQYAQTVAHLNAEQKMGDLTERQKTAAVIAAINQREDAQLALVNKEEADGNLTVQQRQEVENKKTQIIQQAVAQRQKAVDQQYEDEVKVAKSAADAVAGAFSAQLRQVLSGHESWAAAMKNVFAQMVEEMIAKLLKMAAEWVAIHVILAEAQAIFDLATGNPGGAAMASAGAAVISSSTGGLYAEGGTLGAGNWGIAGEAGPELIMGPAHVLPAGMTSALARLTGSSPQSNSTSNADNRQVHVHYDGANTNFKDHAREIAKAVVDHWKSNPSTRPKGW